MDMMKNRLIPLLVASLLVKSAKCIDLQTPKQTATPVLRQGLVQPKPTPKAVLLENDDSLLGRGVSNPTLCGYYNGNLNYPLSCNSGYVCATEASYYAAGCCNPLYLDTCLLPSICIPYGDYCDAECLLTNVAYTSCGALAPYCLTKAYDYNGYFYYEFDCATSSGYYTILPYAMSASVTQNVVSTAIGVQQTKTSGASATAVADTGSGTVIINNNGNNDCQTNCGTGNSNNGGSNDNIGKSGSPSNISETMLALRLWALFHVIVALFV